MFTYIYKKNCMYIYIYRLFSKKKYIYQLNSSAFILSALVLPWAKHQSGWLMSLPIWLMLLRRGCCIMVDIYLRRCYSTMVNIYLRRDYSTMVDISLRRGCSTMVDIYLCVIVPPWLISL